MDASIYTRISADSAGEHLGVKRQEADCRALCERKGWNVAEVYCDNDRSAFDPRKVRPRYQAMLDAVRRGDVQVIVAWHPDRLHRQTRELVPFIDTVNDAGVRVETVTAGHYDLSTPAGRFSARTLGTVAEYESEHKSERVRRKLQQNAADGKHHGGSRPYGWNEDRVTLREDEAAIVLEATERLLAGESVRAVVTDLRARDERTATGHHWTHVTLRSMVLRARNAGLRSYHGKIVGEGQWVRIVEPADFHALHARLTAPGRRTTPGRDGKVHLLSTIAKCGVCGAAVRAAKGKAYKGKAKPIYRCSARSCVTRDQAWTDALVSEIVVQRLSQPDALDLLRRDEEDNAAQFAAARVEELRQRLDDAAGAYAAGSLTLAQLTTITAALEPQIETAQAASVNPQRARLLAGVVGESDVRAAWESFSDARRREIVAALMDVTIMPTKRGHGAPDPASVQVEWKQ
jgi:DNA invertase Pin-like site-specific DNA recombinase